MTAPIFTKKETPTYFSSKAAAESMLQLIHDGLIIPLNFPLYELTTVHRGNFRAELQVTKGPNGFVVSLYKRLTHGNRYLYWAGDLRS